VSEPKLQGKSYDIPKQLVWKAWLKVRSKGGAAGADGVTISQYEENVKNNEDYAKRPEWATGTRALKY
jgi:hypothetical protein